MIRLPLFKTLALALTGICIAHSSSAYNWDEISADDLAASECELDPTAAAEVLYKEIIYDLIHTGGYVPQRFIKYHLRTKIYEKSALDKARRTRFFYSDNFSARAIHARVIKPDGSFTEVNKDDIVKQTERKSNGRILRSTTISLPQVEVGDIVEYKYQLTLAENYYLPKDQVSFQEEWPIRKMLLKMKPYIPEGTGFKWSANKVKKGMNKGKNDFYEMVLENQPGYPEEPYQAPDTDMRSWVAFYNVNTRDSGDKFWKNESKRLHKSMLSTTKTEKTISEKAAELTQGKNTDEQKLTALYDFCRSQIINAYHGKADRLTKDQRQDLDSKWPAHKTLKKGFGTPKNINALFCALARAEGFDARIAHCADRSEYNFTRTMESIRIALPDTIVAIKNGEEWDFHNPGAKYMPFGHLDWLHDQVGVMVPDKKDLILQRTQAAPPEKSTADTKGSFTLSENGDLSGSITMTTTGNPAFQLKRLLDSRSSEERKELAEKALGEHWPNATFDQMQISNAADPFKPLEISFDMKIPSYADIVGDRIFFQPNVEQRYAEAEFPSRIRKTNIFFDFKYRETADISIKIPDGYTLEAPSAPRPFEMKGFMNYAPKLAMNKKTNSIVYKRTVDFMGNSYFPKAYPAIKKAFDDLLKQDHHTLTLKKSDASVNAQADASDTKS